RLRALGDAALRLSPHQPPPARGQRRRLLPGGATSARPRDARGTPPRARARGGGGRAVLLDPSPPRGVGRLDHRAARPHLRPVLPVDDPRLPEGPRAPRPTTGLARRLARLRRAGADLEVDRDGATPGARDPRRVPAPTAAFAPANLDPCRGAAGLAGEDPLRGPGGRSGRHRLRSAAGNRLLDGRGAARPGRDGRLQRVVPRLEDVRTAPSGPALRDARELAPARSRVPGGRG